MKKKFLLLGVGSLLTVSPAVGQNSIGPFVSEMISNYRQEGIIQADGAFAFKDNEMAFSGKLLCADTVIAEKISAIETAFKSPDLDVGMIRQDFDTLLKCISVSGFELKNDIGNDINFTGHFSYPFFSDGSVFTVKSDNGAFQINYGLNERQQTVNVNVTTAEGKTFGNFVLEYDADAMAPLFELGMMTGIAGYAFPNIGIEEKIQQEVLGLSFPAWNSSRFSKAEIYRPTGEAVLLYNKDLNDNSTLSVFTSENKETMKLDFNGQVLNLKVDFPKSNMTLLETKLTFPENFGDKYGKYLEKLYVNKGVLSQNEMSMEGAQLIAGTKMDGVLYGLNGQPLAQIALKLKDEIDLNSIMVNNAPMESVASFEIKNLADNGCSIKTMAFSQLKPNVLTICRAEGCQDENIESSQYVSELMGCFGEIPVVFQRFQNEVKQEIDTIGKAFMVGIMGKPYVANEILNTAAKVAVIAMSKNAADGGDADLSDLGGVASLDEAVKKVILTDTSIRSDKKGTVTIELEPNAAKDIMPLLNELIGSKIVSGCMPDTNICELRF